MGVGPNYVLSKGFLAQGGVAYSAGLLLIAGSVEQSVALAAAAALNPLGVCTEDIDIARVATNKAFVGVALYGIARVKCGAAVAKNARITSDSTARGITLARTAAASQLFPHYGIALTATSNANEFFDMLLTPGAVY